MFIPLVCRKNISTAAAAEAINILQCRQTLPSIKNKNIRHRQESNPDVQHTSIVPYQLSYAEIVESVGILGHIVSIDEIWFCQFWHVLVTSSANSDDASTWPSRLGPMLLPSNSGLTSHLGGFPWLRGLHLGARSSLGCQGGALTRVIREGQNIVSTLNSLVNFAYI